jgi:peptidoglycan-associated lipoprotein
MRHSLPGIIGAAMILLAGCSSKSAVSTNGAASSGVDSGAGSGAGGGAGASVNSGTGAGMAGPVISDIFFDFDSAALSSESQEQLKQNAAWMQSHSPAAVIVEGHCDERGTDEYNMALGERRADAAKDFLVRLGVPGSRLTTVSYGKERQFDPGHNEEAWAKNRRDHFDTK